MWVLVVSIIAFAIILFIVNLIDKNKEKLIKKYNIEKVEIKKCPQCFRQYDNLKLKECESCNVPLEKSVKYSLPKKLKKKIIWIVIVVITVIIIGVGLYFGITSYIEEQQRLEKYNNDLSTCYEVIKNDSDFAKFTSIISEHTEETEFSSEAYQMLYKAIDERIENIKNGNDDEELVNMIKSIKDQNSSNQTIANKYLIGQGKGQDQATFLLVPFLRTGKES